MKKYTFATSLVLMGLCLCSQVFGAASTVAALIEKLNRLEKKSDTDTLVNQRKQVREVLLQMGESKDESVKPILEKYLKQSRSRRLSTLAGVAQVSLAKFDNKMFAEVLKELSPANSIRIQEEAFTKLAMIGDRRAVVALGGYLRDDAAPSVSEDKMAKSLPPGARRQGVIKSFPRSLMAAQALAEIIKDRPTQTKPDFYTEEDVSKWREWWQKNKIQYDGK